MRALGRRLVWLFWAVNFVAAYFAEDAWHMALSGTWLVVMRLGDLREAQRPHDTVRHRGEGWWGR